MSDDFTADNAEDLTRYECPHCGKAFDVAGNKWQNDGVICPYCGAEVE